MKRFRAGDLAKCYPSLCCTDCEREVSQAPEGQQWVFQVNRYYCPKCAEREGLY